jgi:hypothetical protein
VTTIRDFILARIEEDEAAAKVAEGRRWVRSPNHNYGGIYFINCAGEIATVRRWQNAAHMVRHQPQRVLAQCAALREIVKLHKVRDFSYDLCYTCDPDSPGGPYMHVPCPTLIGVASIWIGHPDWQNLEN